MVGEWNGNAIVVDNLFVNADFQIGECEDRWAVRVSDMFHCRLTFHCCEDFIHNRFFRIRKC